jgi:hypothetical protein
MTNRVIVFSSHNIYTEGVVSRLRDYRYGDEIQFIDADERDYIEKVIKLDPSVFIIDSAENEDTQCCLLCELLTAFPSVTIIRLKVHARDVQVISSSPHVLENVQDLIDLIGKNND